MCNVECIHLANCINANTSYCQSCENNKNHKHNYYRPLPYQPYYPNPYPWYPVTITWGTSNTYDKPNHYITCSNT